MREAKDNRSVEDFIKLELYDLPNVIKILENCEISVLLKEAAFRCKVNVIYLILTFAKSKGVSTFQRDILDIFTLLPPIYNINEIHDILPTYGNLHNHENRLLLDASDVLSLNEICRFYIDFSEYFINECNNLGKGLYILLQAVKNINGSNFTEYLDLVSRTLRLSAFLSFQKNHNVALWKTWKEFSTRKFLMQIFKLSGYSIIEKNFNQYILPLHLIQSQDLNQQSQVLSVRKLILEEFLEARSNLEDNCVQFNKVSKITIQSLPNYLAKPHLLDISVRILLKPKIFDMKLKTDYIRLFKFTNEMAKSSNNLKTNRLYEYICNQLAFIDSYIELVETFANHNFDLSVGPFLLSKGNKEVYKSLVKFFCTEIITEEAAQQFCTAMLSLLTKTLEPITGASEKYSENFFICFLEALLSEGKLNEIFWIIDFFPNSHEFREECESILQLYSSSCEIYLERENQSMSKVQSAISDWKILNRIKQKMNITSDLKVYQWIIFSEVLLENSGIFITKSVFNKFISSEDILQENIYFVFVVDVLLKFNFDYLLSQTKFFYLDKKILSKPSKTPNDNDTSFEDLIKSVVVLAEKMNLNLSDDMVSEIHKNIIKTFIRRGDVENLISFCGLPLALNYPELLLKTLNYLFSTSSHDLFERKALDELYENCLASPNSCLLHCAAKLQECYYTITNNESINSVKFVFENAQDGKAKEIFYFVDNNILPKISSLCNTGLFISYFFFGPIYCAILFKRFLHENSLEGLLNQLLIILKSWHDNNQLPFPKSDRGQWFYRFISCIYDCFALSFVDRFEEAPEIKVLYYQNFSYHHDDNDEAKLKNPLFKLVCNILKQQKCEKDFVNDIDGTVSLKGIDKKMLQNDFEYQKEVVHLKYKNYFNKLFLDVDSKETYEQINNFVATLNFDLSVALEIQLSILYNKISSENIDILTWEKILLKIKFWTQFAGQMELTMSKIYQVPGKSSLSSNLFLIKTNCVCSTNADGYFSFYYKTLKRLSKWCPYFDPLVLLNIIPDETIVTNDSTLSNFKSLCRSNSFKSMFTNFQALKVNEVKKVLKLLKDLLVKSNKIRFDSTLQAEFEMTFATEFLLNWGYKFIKVETDIEKFLNTGLQVLDNHFGMLFLCSVFEQFNEFSFSPRLLRESVLQKLTSSEEKDFVMHENLLIAHETYCFFEDNSISHTLKYNGSFGINKFFANVRKMELGMDFRYALTEHLVAKYQEKYDFKVLLELNLVFIIKNYLTETSFKLNSAAWLDDLLVSLKKLFFVEDYQSDLLADDRYEVTNEIYKYVLNSSETNEISEAYNTTLLFKFCNLLEDIYFEPERRYLELLQKLVKATLEAKLNSDQLKESTGNKSKFKNIDRAPRVIFLYLIASEQNYDILQLSEVFHDPTKLNLDSEIFKPSRKSLQIPVTYSNLIQNLDALADNNHVDNKASVSVSEIQFKDRLLLFLLQEDITLVSKVSDLCSSNIWSSELMEYIIYSSSTFEYSHIVQMLTFFLELTEPNFYLVIQELSLCLLSVDNKAATLSQSSLSHFLSQVNFKCVLSYSRKRGVKLARMLESFSVRKDFKFWRMYSITCLCHLSEWKEAYDLYTGTGGSNNVVASFVDLMKKPEAQRKKLWTDVTLLVNDFEQQALIKVGFSSTNLTSIQTVTATARDNLKKHIEKGVKQMKARNVEQDYLAMLKGRETQNDKGETEYKEQKWDMISELNEEDLHDSIGWESNDDLISNETTSSVREPSIANQKTEIDFDLDDKDVDDIPSERHQTWSEESLNLASSDDEDNISNPDQTLRESSENEPNLEAKWSSDSLALSSSVGCTQTVKSNASSSLNLSSSDESEESFQNDSESPKENKVILQNLEAIPVSDRELPDTSLEIGKEHSVSGDEVNIDLGEDKRLKYYNFF